MEGLGELFKVLFAGVKTLLVISILLICIVVYQWYRWYSSDGSSAALQYLSKFCASEKTTAVSTCDLKVQILFNEERPIALSAIR